MGANLSEFSLYMTYYSGARNLVANVNGTIYQLSITEPGKNVASNKTCCFLINYDPSQSVDKFKITYSFNKLSSPNYVNPKNFPNYPSNGVTITSFVLGNYSSTNGASNNNICVFSGVYTNLAIYQGVVQWNSITWV